MRLRITSVLLPIVLASSNAVAVPPDSAQTDFAVSQGNSLDGPTANSAGSSTQSKASATISGDSSSAAATQLSHMWPILPNGAIQGNLAASAPLSETNAPKPALGSVSSLSAGVNAKISATYFLLPGIDSFVKINDYTQHFNEDCDGFIRNVFGPDYYYNQSEQERARDPHDFYWVGKLVQYSCMELTDPSNLRDAVTKINANIKAINDAKLVKPAIPAIVLHAGWQETAKDTSALLLSDHDRYVPSNKMPPLQTFGLSLLGNQHSYSYVTTAAPSKIQKSSEEGWGISGNYAVLFKQASVILGYSYEKPYKGGTGTQVCEPIGKSTSTSCSAANVGAPVKSLDHIFSFESRILVTTGFAVAPRVEYNKTTANLGASLPLYFVPDKKKTLTGGLNVGWTRQGGYQGAVVISKAFSFLD